MKEHIFTWALLIISITSLAQSKYFEGYIDYEYSEKDKNGFSFVPPLYQSYKLYLQPNILLRAIKQPEELDPGFNRVYSHAVRKIQYLFTGEQMVKSYNLETNLKPLNVIEERKEGEIDTLGQKCEVNFIKYVMQYEGIQGEIIIDTLSSTFYCSKKYKFQNIKIFAGLNKNRNLLLLDGRYEGIPVKVVVRQSNLRTKTSFICKEIKEMNVDSVFEILSKDMLKE